MHMVLTERELLKVQQANPACRVELRDGRIIIMSPSGALSEVIAVMLASRLNAWVHPKRLGYILGSNGGFRLPNGDIIAPDVSFVTRDRLPTLPGGFADAVPNLAVEVKSPSDRIRELEEKLGLLRELDAQITWLIDPDQRTVAVHELGHAQLLKDGDTLHLTALLPGWSMQVQDLWPD
jgi:Uma2 family endonuclease